MNKWIALVAAIISVNAFAENNTFPQNKFSIATGFSGSNLSDANGVKQESKGFFINGAYHVDDLWNFWIELDQQKTSERQGEILSQGNHYNYHASYDLNETSLGFQYQWNVEPIYVGIGMGIGFARIKYNASVSDGINTTTNSETSDYFSWKVIDLELGANLNQNFSSFMNVGYKILFSPETEEICGRSSCVSMRAEDLDLDGATYQVGLRYRF